MFAREDLPTKNIALLAACQAVVGSQQALVMTVGALVGISLAPDPRLATLPTTSMILGLALTAGPAAIAIHRMGRKRAFMMGTGFAVIGGLIAGLGVFLESFFIFCLALALIGSSAAFGQQYRFAAADSVPPAQKGKAISWVLVGGIAAGFIGPFLSQWGRDLFAGAEYAGSFVTLSGLALIGMAILSQTNLAKAEVESKTEVSRPLREIARAPEIFVPIISGMATYGLMTLVMVAAPLAMVVICGHSSEAASSAIQWHIISMFAPSFFTGHIISRIGARATTGIGLTLILGCALIALNGRAVWNFDLALILLGLGWNFGFIGSTAMLSQGYRPEEAARVQGLNEQVVFGTMAIASISSGLLLQTIGWEAVNILAIPVATLAIGLLAWGDWHARKPQAAE